MDSNSISTYSFSLTGRGYTLLSSTNPETMIADDGKKGRQTGLHIANMYWKYDKAQVSPTDNKCLCIPKQNTQLDLLVNIKINNLRNK